MNKLEIFHGKFSIILITICFIFLTNTYFDYDESILYGAADILYYHQIALSAPELPDKIIEYHYAQRFFVPYTIGIISKIFNLEIIYVARFFVIAILLIQIFYILKINRLIKVKNDINILSVLIILLNPYNFRYYLSNPLMIQDFAFQLCFIILIYFFLKKENLKLISLTFVSYFLRQTSICFFISLLLVSIYDGKFFKFKEICLMIFLFICSLFVITAISSKMAINNVFPYEHITGLYYWIINDSYNSFKLLVFFLLPIISYGPLIIFSILFKKKNNIIQESFFIFLACSIIIIFIQPILAGPHLTGKNIIRLTSLAFPAFVIFCNYKVTINNFLLRYHKFIYKFLPIVLILWSFHPKYSNIGFYFFKNYNFFNIF